MTRTTATRGPEPRLFDKPTSGATGGERTLLVHREDTRDPDQEDLNELRLLAESAGALVCGVLISRRPRPDAATYIGKGKADELAERVRQEEIDLVLVNHDLSPGQERNLERIAGCRVLDRTGLILDIFAQRARSHEGKLQVELAQLEHLSTRLVRGWTHLERQKGGIGLRGPGETQLETDRRLIRERIKSLHRRLEKVRNQRNIRRKSRRKVPIPSVSFVGYTNAGKSSLFNRLTDAGIYAADQLFATLDPTMRRIELPGNTSVILADTVGFIRHLPHDLVEAFKSTLEELEQADLLIHVTDTADPAHEEHEAKVQEVLAEIGADKIPQIRVYNKIDLTGEPAHLEYDARGLPTKAWLSAATGDGVALLLEALAAWFHRFRREYEMVLPPEAGRLRAQIYARFEVLAEETGAAGETCLHLSLDETDVAWLWKQPDFPATALHELAPRLAPTGSCP